MATGAPSTPTREGIAVLHWLFPSRRAGLLVLAVEVSAWLIGLPLPVHLLVSIAVHVAVVGHRWRR